MTLSDGSLRNGYTIKLLNKTREPRAFSLSLDAPPSATMQVVGQHGDAYETVLLSAEPDSVAVYRVYVTMPRVDVAGGSAPLSFLLRDRDSEEEARYASVFRGPGT